MPKLLKTSHGFHSLITGHSCVLRQAAWYHLPWTLRLTPRPALRFSQSSNDGVHSHSCHSSRSVSGNGDSSAQSSKAADSSHPSMPPGWEDDPDLTINTFSQLPHRLFGTNQHIRINEDFKEALRRILWEFKAPIRYAFAYGSGVFAQTTSDKPTDTISPHPHPPEAVTKWQQGGGKIIDFIFGVSFTQHWHSINLQQHPKHYSALRLLGSYPISKIQDSLGAGVYFNPYITANGTMIKYGVVNLDTLCKDLSEWDTLYLAGRLQKPVKILRDDPKVRLANQINLMSAVRTALLMMPETFTERQLYEQIAGISYLGDPRMSYGGENPRKVSNIVRNQLPNFRQLYVPLIENLPNVSFDDHRVPKELGWEKEEVIANSGRFLDDVLGGSEGFTLHQDMDPVRRGNMVRRLPKNFRQKLYYQYKKKFQIPGSAFDKIVDEATDEDDKSFHRRLGGKFEQRIGGDEELSKIVGKCIHNTVSWPSTTQSLKGVLTSGLGRSWRYYSEKRGKNKEGKQQNAQASPPSGVDRKTKEQ